MSINGINSYNIGFYNYQSSINSMRLSQAFSKNAKLSQYMTPAISSLNSPYKSSMNFIKNYTSSMSALLGAASDLKSGNSQSAMKELNVKSSNENVASAAKRFTLRDTKEIKLNVKQTAAAQSNVSAKVKASDVSKKDMNFTLNSQTGPLSISVKSTDRNGVFKTNAQMFREAADQINTHPLSSVTAKVTEKDGQISLELTGKKTGETNTFSVSGELGAAAGLDTVKQTAANAKYAVTADGKTTDYESSTNDITVDMTRIGVTLKGVGETTISADVDSGKLSSAIGNLVDKYNASLKLLNDNYERGSGVDRQLRNLVSGLGSEQSLEKLGISVNKDASLTFDKDVFAENMKKSPDLVKKLISSPGGLADKAYNKAMSGITMNSNSLINGDIETMQSESLTDPFRAFSLYSKSGAYMMNNYAALGMMMNYLV